MAAKEFIISASSCIYLVRELVKKKHLNPSLSHLKNSCPGGII